MTVTAGVPDLVASSTAALAAEQWRVAGALSAVSSRGAWRARLSPDARWQLVRVGHFPAYAAELDWTPREIAGHLRDSARVFTERIRRLCAEDEPRVADFVTDSPERVADYRATPPDVLLDQLRTAQAELLQAVAGVGVGELSRRGVHEVDGPFTLADVLRFLPDHQRDHAEQLRALLPRR
ncbi:DinB family protein [Geodermatophilus sp. YIM 151500]|uniref:DinB family protein n=1 Tax=Geodermatophilus sp. YIM 151500 TaxID=2984531 RepID=UPI0021E38CEF|nr:DinB family protein [Geodermatophilus sp. YIM 151500]MCV2491821.1 DinB family protein [Geodermatophilus sp. YIM 151500]